MKSIPKCDLIILMEIIYELMASRNSRSFECSFKKMQRLLLYDGSICVLSDKDTLINRRPLYSCRTMNFSKEFAEKYASGFYYERSLVFKTAMRHCRPCNWKTFWSMKRNKQSIAAKQLAHAYGYLDGWISASSYLEDPSVALLVFAGRKVDADQRTEAILKYITPHFGEAIKRTFHSKIRRLKQNEGFKLTLRQLEVLKWIKEGKSTWEISIILNRSERVVIWHANNIMQRLGAQNRAHAVAIAMRQRLID